MPASSARSVWPGGFTPFKDLNTGFRTWIIKSIGQLPAIVEGPLRHSVFPMRKNESLMTGATWVFSVSQKSSFFGGPLSTSFALRALARPLARSPLLCSRSIKTANVAADTALRKKIFIGYKDTHLQSNIILHPTTLYSKRVGKRELRKMLDNKLLWRTAIRHVVRHEVVLASASESGEQASERCE